MEIESISECGSQAITEASCRAILEGDHVSRGLGIRLIDAGPARARIGIMIREGMPIGFGGCHAGILFMLADMALPCACNSRNPRLVAHHCSIVFPRPGRSGQHQVAIATERSRTGRIGIYADNILTRSEKSLARSSAFSAPSMDKCSTGNAHERSRGPTGARGNDSIREENANA